MGEHKDIERIPGTIIDVIDDPINPDSQFIHVALDDGTAAWYHSSELQLIEEDAQ